MSCIWKGEPIFSGGEGRREGTYSSKWNRCTGWRLMGVLCQGCRDGNWTLKWRSFPSAPTRALCLFCAPIKRVSKSLDISSGTVSGVCRTHPFPCEVECAVWMPEMGSLCWILCSVLPSWRLITSPVKPMRIFCDKWSPAESGKCCSCSMHACSVTQSCPTLCGPMD